MLATSRISFRSLLTSRTSSTPLKSLPSIRFFSQLNSSPSPLLLLRPTSFLLKSTTTKIQAATYATSTTDPSTTFDPREIAAQEFLDMGNKALDDGDFGAAGRAYEESLKIWDSAIGNYNLGVVRYTEKDLPAAIKAFLQCLTLLPPRTPLTPSSTSETPLPATTEPLTPSEILFADASQNLGGCYILLSPPRPDLALLHLQNALEITPDDPEVVFNLACVLETTAGEVGELEVALMAFEKAGVLGLGEGRVRGKVGELRGRIEKMRKEEEGENKKVVEAREKSIEK